MNEFERRKQDAETVEIVSEVVLDDRARRQAQQEQSSTNADFGGSGFGGQGAGGNGPRGPHDGGFGGFDQTGSDFGRNGPQDVEALAAVRTLSHILYALYLICLFTAGVAGIIPVIIDYVRRPATRGTVYESHSLWRTRTFWWALVGYLVGWSLWWSSLGAGLLILVSIWYIYRCVKGWLRLLENKPVTGRWF